VNRALVLIVAASISACSFAASDSGVPKLSADPITLSSVSTSATNKAQAAGIVPVPKIGIRVSGGNWNEFMVGGGVDVTFNVPFIPLPSIRVDGEIWGKPSNFGKDRRGDAFSVLGIQTFALGYAGLGPSYYFADDTGDHQSGFGLKVLGGLNLPGGTYAEASILFGPKQPPIMFSIGRRF